MPEGGSGDGTTKKPVQAYASSRPTCTAIIAPKGSDHNRRAEWADLLTPLRITDQIIRPASTMAQRRFMSLS